MLERREHSVVLQVAAWASVEDIAAALHEYCGLQADSVHCFWYQPEQLQKRPRHLELYLLFRAAQ